MSLYTLAKSNVDYKFFQYLTIPFEQVVMAFISPIFPAAKVRVDNKKSKATIVLRILIGVLIAVPFLALFLILLLSADLAFNQIVKDAFSVDILKDILVIIIWFCVGSWFSLGALYYNLYLKKKHTKEEIKKTVKSSRFFIEGLTILSLIELLFFVFNLIQLTYLFGGEGLITGGEFTYSEYARKGFFELVAVSVIALGLYGLIFKIKRTKNNVQKKLFSSAGVFGLILLLPMSGSAFYRLMMYEQAYGFTELRIYSHLFIIYLFVLYLLFAIKFTTKLKETYFLYAFEIITVLAISITGFLNVDGVIADFNITNAKNVVTENDSLKYSNKRFGEVAEEDEEVGLDLEYLNTLSYDAIPRQIKLFNESEGELKQEIAFYLEAKYLWMTYDEDKDFRQYTLRYLNARSLLKKHKDEIFIESDKYEQTIIQNYKNEYVDSRDSYDFDWQTECKNDEYKLSLIDKHGYAFLHTDFNIFTFPEEEEKPFVVTINDCLTSKTGTYYIVTSEWDGWGNKVKAEVFLISLDDYDEKIFLVSRREYHY
jgi:hypothetical protein